MSKRAPYPQQPEDPSGKTLWRSLGELNKDPEFEASKHREFEDNLAEDAFRADLRKDGRSEFHQRMQAEAAAPGGLQRRSFLGIMGASVALAGLAGCRRPVEHILPYSHAPEEVIPGRPLHFATTMPWIGGALGLVVESHEGRPTKVEGNPAHPESLGGTFAFAQASVLDLYDPDRSQSPTEKGAARTWDQAASALRALGAKHKASGGEGLVVLTEGHRSPTLTRQLNALKQAMPAARVVRYEPLSDENSHDGTLVAFGRPVDVVLDLKDAKVVLVLDADIFGIEGSVARQTRQFAAGRDYEKKKDDLNRLYVVESSFTQTGGSADHRLRMKSREIAGFTAALAIELKAGSNTEKLKAPELDARGQKWIKAVAKDLLANAGRSVVVAGRKQPAAVHALVALINDAIGAAGKTVHYRPKLDEAPDGARAFAELVKGLGSVKTLVILGGNPAFNAPADAKFADAMKSIETTVHLSTHIDETSSLATWHLDRAHYLESWGDVRCDDGTASIVQPLIAPLYGGKTDIEVVEMLVGGDRKGYEILRETWREVAGAVPFEDAFRQTLRDGVSPSSTPADLTLDVKAADVIDAVLALPAPGGGLEVTFSADPHALDGRFTNNSWMQEVPDGMLKLTWGNAAVMSKKTADKLGVVDGDVVALKVGGSELKIPALVAPGHVDDSIALTVGQGRRVVGRVGRGVELDELGTEVDPTKEGKPTIGYDTYPLRATGAFDIASDATVTKTGENWPLARTQEHYAMEGRPMVLSSTAEEFAKDPVIVHEHPKAPPLLSLWKERSYHDAAWGMTIDLNQCTGCNACTIACQAENNIPVVGRQGVLQTREMHWIRVDRYFEGLDTDEPETVVQPMMCQHCENAPCEQVCPVGATTTSPEGLNEMAYNRCIGTKYCANNCPYKVRRFNYFNYSINIPESRKAQFNPDVTVRFRGVMEKCTFCVQRINHKKIDAKKEGRSRLRDGEVQAACQQACPADAIHFGDLNDPSSEVAKSAGSGRAYKVLDFLNVKPRVSYLARIKNPNPELVGA